MAKVGAAQVNCKPALVFRIGTDATNSGVGRFSSDNAVKRCCIDKFRVHINKFTKSS